MFAFSQDTEIDKKCCVRETVSLSRGGAVGRHSFSSSLPLQVLDEKTGDVREL